jgi:2-methylcitrate dehydratase
LTAPRRFEDRRFSRDYLDPRRRSIGNAITVVFKDGSRTPGSVVEYPVGHRRRRGESIPVPIDRFRDNPAHRFPGKQQRRILEVALDARALGAAPVHEFVDMMII